MLLLSGQTANRFDDFLSRQLHRIFYRHSFDHFREGRAARQRGRAAVSEKARNFNAAVPNAQTNTETIAADGVCFVGDGICVRQFACVARICDVILEDV